MASVFLPLILLLGTLGRIYNNVSLALWHDEAFSALFLRYDWGEMMYRIGLDVHPPLYYILLRFWSYLAGDGLLALRLFSIIFGGLTIWAGYLFVKAAFGSKKLALLAALLLALNPFQIQYSLEARMYTLGTFLAMISSYFLVRALDNRKYWLWYALAAAAGIYTHYYLFLTLAAQGFFVLLCFLKSRNFKLLLRAVGSYLLVGILYLPWLKTFGEQVSRVQENYWIPRMNAWSVPGTVWKMVFGGQGVRNSILLAATLGSLLILFYFIQRVRSFQKWHILFGLLIPIVGAVLLSLKTNLYLDRYFVFASLYFVILIVLTFAQIQNWFWKFATIFLLTLSMVFTFFKNWDDLDITNKPGMAEAARYINGNAKSGDQIYVGSSFVYFTFKYYNKTGIPPLLYSPGSLESIPHFSGTALLTNEDLITDFNLAPQNSTTYLLWTTGFGGSKPQVPSNWIQIEEKGYQDAPGFKGWIVVTKYLLK